MFPNEAHVLVPNYHFSSGVRAVAAVGLVSPTAGRAGAAPATLLRLRCRKTVLAA